MTSMSWGEAPLVFGLLVSRVDSDLSDGPRTSSRIVERMFFSVLMVFPSDGGLVFRAKVDRDVLLLA